MNKQLAKIKAVAETLLEAKSKSTPVNAWYPHSEQGDGHIRGPWNRWFNCLEPFEECSSNNSTSDKIVRVKAEHDINYCAQAMNDAPELASTVLTLVEVIQLQQEALNDCYLNTKTERLASPSTRMNIIAVDSKEVLEVANKKLDGLEVEL